MINNELGIYSISRIMRTCGMFGIPFDEVLNSPYFIGREKPKSDIQYRDGVQGTVGWGNDMKPLNEKDIVPFDKIKLLNLLGMTLLASDELLLNEDISNKLANINSSEGKQPFDKRIAKIRARNSKISKELKKLYENRCQISGYDFTFKKENGEYYSELHHIIPLGEEGSDSYQNAIIVSPLIHRMLHFANVSSIDITKINTETLDLKFIINNVEYVIKWHEKHFETMSKSLE